MDFTNKWVIKKPAHFFLKYKRPDLYETIRK
jgi:hypothetical protein